MIKFASPTKVEVPSWPKHMKQLYDLSAAPTKRWKPLPGGDHNSSVLEEGYFEAMSDFIAEVTGDTPQEKTRL
ncbi:putative glycerol-3-phosphate dehydrogenase [Fusarium oxysporum f. sp. albedinis]|nr:putative glycerol-3-phosphate dehydrogenase [Fusarium oxysporum f. sp. albedinis]